jgi:hypothetical protein
MFPVGNAYFFKKAEPQLFKEKSIDGQKSIGDHVTS